MRAVVEYQRAVDLWRTIGHSADHNKGMDRWEPGRLPLAAARLLRLFAVWCALEDVLRGFSVSNVHVFILLACTPPAGLQGCSLPFILNSLFMLYSLFQGCSCIQPPWPRAQQQ
jgi:hypothetical protein